MKHSRTLTFTALFIAGSCLAARTSPAQRSAGTGGGTSAGSEHGEASQGDQLSPQDAQMLELARDAANRIQQVMDGWIAQRLVSDKQVFSSLYYPIADTNPQKFTTDWDKLADRDFQAIEEGLLSRSSDLRFVVVVDRNGYLPTHNKRYSQALTGNLEMDLKNSRTKRIFNDITGLSAARNTRPYLLQNYKRDTGESMKDLSVPILVGGKHWGAIRFGYMASK